MQEENARLIDARLVAGLALLREHFAVEEREVDPVLANPVIGGRPHHARRFDIAGVGNLLLMTVKDAAENQLSSFVITPYAKNPPLFSSDYVYTGERRFFLLEVYDLGVRHADARDAAYDEGMKAFAALGAQWQDMPDFPTRPCWYDGIRPVCVAKAPSRDQDELALQRFLEFLELFVRMAQAAPALEGDDLIAKWQLNKGYSDRLVDEGGVSTDLFVEALGPDNTRRFFDEVFFAPACYRHRCIGDSPQCSVFASSGTVPNEALAAMKAFFAQTDENGVTNAEKAAKLHHTIRRVPTTSKDCSFEDAEDAHEPHNRPDDLPFGVVVVDGKLVGLGIHILNEDVYPLQSFEIYLRGCDLTGHLDLSNCTDMVFVDLYRNRISSVNLANMPALRILGLQGNRISALDPTGMPICQGIDIGMNRLAAIDVSRNPELVELYVNDNQLTELDTSHNPKLKYLRCQNNRLTELDVVANRHLRHLYATGNPLKLIRAWAPVGDDAAQQQRRPIELRAGEGGCVGLSFNPIYNAQWKETGEWEQSYHAYPDDGFAFAGWFDGSDACVSREQDWEDEYGTSHCLVAKFVAAPPS